MVIGAPARPRPSSCTRLPAVVTVRPSRALDGCRPDHAMLDPRRYRTFVEMLGDSACARSMCSRMLGGGTAGGPAREGMSELMRSLRSSRRHWGPPRSRPRRRLCCSDSCGGESHLPERPLGLRCRPIRGSPRCAAASRAPSARAHRWLAESAGRSRRHRHRAFARETAGPFGGAQQGLRGFCPPMSAVLADVEPISHCVALDSTAYDSTLPAFITMGFKAHVEWRRALSAGAMVGDAASIPRPRRV